MRSFRHYVCLALFMVALAGCDRTQPIYNVEANPVPMVANHHVAANQLADLITKTALEAGWVVEKTQPGALRCTLKWREHTAVVDVTYTNKTYSIHHVSTENLLEENGMVHRKYNERIHQLQDAIDRAVSKRLNG